MIELKKSPSLQPRKPAPDGVTVVTFGVYSAGGDRVAANYFTSQEGDPFETTTLSVALREPLDAERLEQLRLFLEGRINALKEEKYSYFLEIAAEVCADLGEFGVVGHSSYVPD